MRVRWSNELADREAIRELIFRYGRGVDDANVDLVLSVFDDPCTVIGRSASGARHEYSGRPAVEAFYKERAEHNAKSRLLRHRFKNPIIRVEGKRAHGNVYWDEYRERDNTLLLAGGVYVDRFHKTRAGWRIQERSINATYSLVLLENVDQAIEAGRLVLGQRALPLPTDLLA